ncbi:nucleoside diphosphate kinase [candidate division SR1 bacterium]|nr:nucleoside diphosphate kinase [candidate division SR1 bacterium]
MSERTLIILKPDAVQRSVCGEILSRFERRGLKIVGTKMVSPNRDFFYQHYETIGTMISRRGEAVFNVTLESMQKGPVIAIVLEGIEAVKIVRQMVGATEPASANPGTIRGDFAHMSFSYGDQEKKGIPNLIHASGDSEEAKKEIDLWFSPNELYDYVMCNECFIR